MSRAAEYRSRGWQMVLPPLFAVGAGLFTWSVLGALQQHGAVRWLLAAGAAAGLLLVWLAESTLLQRVLNRTFADVSSGIAISWLPLAILPAAAPYFTQSVTSTFLKGNTSTTRILVLALWLLFLALSGSVILKLILFWERTQAALSFLEHRALRFLWGGAAVYFAVFTSLAFLAYHWFLDYHSDLAQYSQTFWVTLRGHVFLSTLEETSNSFLGTHISPFLLVFVIPVYALWQSPLMYLLLRSFGLTLAAFPLFYCVRHYTKSAVAGLFLAAAFLFHPEIVSQHFTSGYETLFVAAPFFASFFFFLKKRFGFFFLFLLVTVAVREDFIPAALIFAVYALAQRRSLKWILAPLSVGLVWGAAVLIIFRIVIEHFMFNLYYGHLGSTPGAMIHKIITNPVYVMGEIKRLHSSYLYNLLAPEGFVLPWAGFASIFALPNIGISVLRGADASGMAGGIAHYSVLVVSAFWLGMASLISRLQKRLPGREQTVAVFCSVIVVVLVAASAHIWVYFLPKAPPPDASALSRAIAVVPPDASVSSNDGRALAHLSNRWGLYEPLVWDVPAPPDRLPQGIEQLKADYVLLRPFGNSQFNDEGAFRFLIEPGSPYELVFEQDGIRLFKKK